MACECRAKNVYPIIAELERRRCFLPAHQLHLLYLKGELVHPVLANLQFHVLHLKRQRRIIATLKRAGANVKKEFISERKPHAYYVVRCEKWNLEHGTDASVEMEACYSTKDNGYIGDVDTAEFLCSEKGILPEKAEASHNVCSIGYCKSENKWYGWSHRAMYGFGIGDKLFESNYGNENTHFSQHGTKTIQTKKDMKQAAKNFAAHVS